MNRRYCTAPNILGFREWFTKRFNSACKKHDEAYLKKRGWRIYHDFIFFLNMCKLVKWRLHLLPFCFATFIFLVVFGWIAWFDVKEKIFKR